MSTIATWAMVSILQVARINLSPFCRGYLFDHMNVHNCRDVYSINTNVAKMMTYRPQECTQVSLNRKGLATCIKDFDLPLIWSSVNKWPNVNILDLIDHQNVLQNTSNPIVLRGDLILPHFVPVLSQDIQMSLSFLYSVIWGEEVVVHFVDLSGIVDNHCINFLFIKKSSEHFLLSENSTKRTPPKIKKNF
jgi:hypothetical protein